MSQKEAIKLLEDKKVCAVWDNKKEDGYFSIVDTVGVLSDSPNPRKYWSVLKPRLKKEDSELTTNCSQLKMHAADGKMYKTDVANKELMFRLIQRIKSIEVRKELTDEWDRCGVKKGPEYASLIVITKAWSGRLQSNISSSGDLKKRGYVL